jgi:hypothetical protein
MSGPLGAAPGVAATRVSAVARCPVIAAAHVVSHRLLVRFGAASHAPAMLRSHGWQSAGRPTETIDEPRPRAARPPFLFAAAGVQ